MVLAVVRSSPAAPPASVSPSPAPCRRWPRPQRRPAARPLARTATLGRSRRSWTTPTASWRCRRASAYAVVTHTGADRARRDGQGLTPSDHDGMAVFDAGRGRLHLIQNHELDAGRGRSAYRTSRARSTTRAPSTAGGCTVIKTDRARPQPRRVRRHLRHLANCAGGPDPVGHLADLRGDRDQGRDRVDRQRRADRRLRRRTTATSSRSSADGRSLPEADQVPGPVRPRGAGRRPGRAPSVYLSEDASSPNGLFYRWTAPRGVKLGPGVAQPPRPERRRARGDGRSSWTTARCCPTSPT